MPAPALPFSPRSTKSTSWQPKKLNSTMTLMLDCLFANPTLKNADLAEQVGRTKEWVYMVRNSDVFKEAEKERLNERAKSVDAFQLRKLEELVEGSLDGLNAKVKNPLAVPIQELRACAELGLNYSGKNPQSNIQTPNVAVNTIVISREDLESARQRAYPVINGGKES